MRINLAFAFLLVLSACQTQPMLPTVTTTQQPKESITETPFPSQALTPSSNVLGLKIFRLFMFDGLNGWALASKEVDNDTYLVRTEDGGKTWYDLTPYDYIIDGHGDFFFLDSQTVWLPTYAGLLKNLDLIRTIDGGQAWTFFSPDFYYPDYFFEDDNHGWAIDSSRESENEEVNVYETWDGGANWELILITPPRYEKDAVSGSIPWCFECGDLVYYDPTRFIKVHGNMNAESPISFIEVDISFDLGRSWVNLDLPLPSQYANGYFSSVFCHFFDSRNGLLGINYSKSPNSFFSDALVMYETDDGGATWTVASASEQIKGNNIDATPVDVISPDDMIMGCGYYLCVTHDGAHTWEMITSNLKPDVIDGRTNNSIFDFDFVDLRIGFSVIYTTDGNLNLYKTTDGGWTWSPLNPQFK